MAEFTEVTKRVREMCEWYGLPSCTDENGKVCPLHDDVDAEFDYPCKFDRVKLGKIDRSDIEELIMRRDCF